MSDDELSEYQRGLLEIVQNATVTPEQVAIALGMLSSELEKVRVKLDAAEDVMVEAIEDHGRAYDQEFLKAAFDPKDPTKRATEKVREATARKNVWDLRLKMEQAKAEVRKLKRNADVLDRRIFVGQSIAKTLRAEMRNLGYSDWGS